MPVSASQKTLFLPYKFWIAESLWHQLQPAPDLKQLNTPTGSQMNEFEQMGAPVVFLPDCQL